MEDGSCAQSTALVLFEGDTPDANVRAEEPYVSED